MPLPSTSSADSDGIDLQDSTDPAAPFARQARCPCPPSNTSTQGEQAPCLDWGWLRDAVETAQRVGQGSSAALRTLGAALGPLAACARDVLRQALTPRGRSEKPGPCDHITLPIGVTLEQAERELIRCTFAACQRSRQRTADMLGISRRSLYSKLREHKIPLS
ncbi:MAG: helix-turn-helix domain-containing protein [Polyangia bacterium]